MSICGGAIAGALASAGWAPLDWIPFAIVGYAVLFWLLQLDLGCRTALLTGLAFGIGLHSAGHGWMFTTLHTKVGLGSTMAGGAAIIFILYLALFTAFPCALMGFAIRSMRGRYTAPHSWIDVASFAAFLTVGEWTRSTLFNGFTSLSIGYTTLNTWLAGYAPIGGLYLAGLVAYLLAGLLASAARNSAAAINGGIFIVALLAGGWATARIEWHRPVGSALSYRLVQSNVEQLRKFDPQYASQHARHVTELIADAPADIIATPETTFKAYLNELPGDTLIRLQQFSRRTSSYLFLGTATAAANSDGYNSVLEISPDRAADGIARYDKVRLMPFGEYSPAGFSWFTNSLSIPLKDMSAGSENQRPFILTKAGTTVRIGTLICLEDMIGRDAARWAPSSNLLLNPTNLAWFEGTIAIDQRLQIARMRALEVARPILRVANTGITAHIDPHGNLMATVPANVETVLSGFVQPTTGLTPYARVGDGLALLLCFAAATPMSLRVGRRSRGTARNA